MMIGRVRQFFLAAFARISASDREYVERSLVPALRRLFFEMSVPDQCHAVRTARCAQMLMRKFSEPEPVDSAFLTRCALLHDIGRKKGDLGTIWKSIAVLFSALFPKCAYAYGNSSEGLLAKKNARIFPSRGNRRGSFGRFGICGGSGCHSQAS